METSEESTLLTEEVKGEEEVKSEEEKAEGEKSEEDKEPEGAPEAYEEFELPEGVEKDQEALDAFLPIAKELNLTQQQAQQLVDLQVQQGQKAAEASQAAWDELQKGWIEEAKSDAEMGGQNFQATVQDAKAFVKQFDNEGGELAAALNATGVGNHPAFIRAFAKAGKLLSEDGVRFGNSGTDTIPIEKRIFPNHN